MPPLNAHKIIFIMTLSADTSNQKRPKVECGGA